MDAGEGLPVITDRTPEVVMAHLVRHGAVVVRDAGASQEDFRTLGDALMSPRRQRWAPEVRGPVTGDPTTTTVTAGTVGIPLHREASYAPGSPSMITFYCVRPAAVGGRTLVCDGVTLLRELPAALRRYVTDRGLFWESDLPARHWQATWRTTDPAVAARAIRDRAAALLPWESLSARFVGDVMSLRFGTSCTPPTLFDGEPAFCNSLLILGSHAGADTYEERELRALLADGDPFPEGVLADVDRVAAGLTVEVDWRPGDILLVDNTRVMHGRRPFTGERRILVRMGDVHARWLPGGLEPAAGTAGGPPTGVEAS
jgi:alpha-ketoglutarate-dependent taurine dioxygenase